MEESKRKEIRDYIESQVNPVIRPLVVEIVRKRPSNIAGFINEYSFRLMSKSLSIQTTRTNPDSSLIPTKIAKRLKLSFCASCKNARRRKLRKRIVVKASVLNASANSTLRSSSRPR
jgi:polyphosphate kinase